MGAKIHLDPPTRCPECGSDYVRLVENKVMYGKNFGVWPWIYFCYSCTAAVGCHPNTEIPMGIMAGKEVRQLRRAAHKVFDPLWQNTKWLKRSSAYVWLAKEMGIPPEHCHISWFNSEQCQQVIDICLTKRPKKVERHEFKSKYPR